jgi:peptidoglycan hydrolase CwlO-like protein
MAKAEFAVELEIVTCYACGIVFAFPSLIMRRRLNDHQSFWCPNGHSQAFLGESEADKLTRELKRYQRQAELLQAEAAHQREQKEAAQRNLRSTKAQLTKTKKRIANGVCPCCNRTFQNLARHMKGQHPEYEEQKT